MSRPGSQGIKVPNDAKLYKNERTNTVIEQHSQIARSTVGA